MEWSKDKTMKLIELLQMNPNLWNPSLCDTRRDKQKRREELRNIADNLEVYVADATRKIQHLRTQYNRESAREVRAHFEVPDERYVSSWYAYEYLHFLKDSNKPYRVLQSKMKIRDDSTEVNEISSHEDNISDCKYTSMSPPLKMSRIECSSVKAETGSASRNHDDLSVFGEYVANELRSLKGEKNLLVAKKKILDVIFEVKLGSTCEPEPGPTVCTVYAHLPRPANSLHNDKGFATPISTAQIEPLTATHSTPTTGISEIIINSACHYSNFKADSQ